MNTITQQQLDLFKSLYPQDAAIQNLTLELVLENAYRKSTSWEAVASTGADENEVLLQSLSDCDKAKAYVVFDVLCVVIGAAGLRKAVKPSTIEAIAKATAPAMSKLETAIARIAAEGATKTEMAKAAFDILNTIVAGGMLSAVYHAFANSLTWWDMVLYGITGVATIIAAVGTDGLAFVAEFAVVMASVGFVVSDAFKAVSACKIEPLPSGKPYTQFELHETTVLSDAEFDKGRYVILTGQANEASDNHDLYCIKRSHCESGHIEVHIANGNLPNRDSYSRWKLEVGSALLDNETGLVGYFVGDFGSNHRDLYYLKQGTDALEVHVLNSAQNYGGFRMQEKTQIRASDLMNYAFAVGNYYDSGVADIFCIKVRNTESKKLEIYVLNGQSMYKDSPRKIITGIDSTEVVSGKYKFLVGRYQRVVGKSDLFMLKCANTDTGKVEVTVLNANDEYGTKLLENQPTPIPVQDYAYFEFTVGDCSTSHRVAPLYCLKHHNTAGTVELHSLV